MRRRVPSHPAETRSTNGGSARFSAIAMSGLTLRRTRSEKGRTLGSCERARGRGGVRWRYYSWLWCVTRRVWRATTSISTTDVWTPVSERRTNRHVQLKFKIRYQYQSIGCFWKYSINFDTSLFGHYFHHNRMLSGKEKRSLSEGALM